MKDGGISDGKREMVCLRLYQQANVETPAKDRVGGDSQQTSHVAGEEDH